MKVALCCIGRLENQYAVEFIEWHKSIGFDKIFIYDNNHDGEDSFEDVIQNYIDDGFVELISWRNKDAAQLPAYNDFYKKHGSEYDWIAFFDFDEFLTLVQDNDVKSYLNKFNGFDAIKLNWMTYTDNGLIINDGRPVLERFTQPMEYDKHFNYSFPENNHVKLFVRGGISNFKWSGVPHIVSMNLKYADSTGKASDNKIFQPYDFSVAYLKHFSMKTIDEYLNKKRIRGHGNRSYAKFKQIFKADDFFKINEKTDEKVKFVDNFIKSLDNK